MMKYTELMTGALKANADRINVLIACEGFINPLDKLAKSWETNLEIESVSISFPNHGSDYTSIRITLKEKGSIKKDVGFILEDLASLSMVISTSKYVDNNEQNFSWWLKYTKASFDGAHPRLRLAIDASKSTKCVQVDTGKTQPVYEMRCEDE